MLPTPDATFILALDVGNKRVGVAVASLIARLPRPLTTLERGEDFFDRLDAIITAEHVEAVVVGLPRDLNGRHTAQTTLTEDFISQLKKAFDGPVHIQDEALTSQKAETELRMRGGTHSRGDIDALAATYILEDFLAASAQEQKSETA